MTQNCSLCQETSIIHCVNRSLYHKYKELVDKPSGIIYCILGGEEIAFQRYNQALIEFGEYDYLSKFVSKNIFKQQIADQLQYYKYRVYVPIFVKSRPYEFIQNYYYSKLRNHYNSIKRKLNMEVDCSELSLPQKSQVRNSQVILSNILNEIKMEAQVKPIQSIKDYTNESKALQQMVSYLKLNSQFQQIPTLNTQDCFKQQLLFEQNIKLIKNRGHKQAFQSKKSTIKVRILDKYSGDIIIKDIKKNITKRQSLSSDTELIKQNYQDSASKAKTNIESQSPYSIKQTLRVRSINRRYSSVGNFYKYEKKLPNQIKVKKSESTKIFNRIHQYRNNQLIIKHEQSPQSKKSVIKIQMIKFQNRSIDRAKRPSSQTKGRSSRQIINEKDNLYSMRKKKLQLIRQKVSKYKGGK